MLYTTWGKSRTDPSTLPIYGAPPAIGRGTALVALVFLVSAGALLGLVAMVLTLNNPYPRGIVSQSSAGFVEVTMGLLFWLAVGVALPLNERVPLLLASLVFLCLGTPDVLRASQDILSGPVYARGLVAERQSRIVVVETIFHTRQHRVFELVVAGRTWSISRQDYDRLAVGTCVVVTYGPRTGYPTGAAAC